MFYFNFLKESFKVIILSFAFLELPITSRIDLGIELNGKSSLFKWDEVKSEKWDQRNASLVPNVTII